MNEFDPNNYIVIRVQAVNVKKRAIFKTEKILGMTSMIPENDKKAMRIYKELVKLLEKHGVKIDMED